MLLSSISWLAGNIQRVLFPELEEILTDPLTKKQQQLVTVLEIVQIENHMWWVDTQCIGRKLKERYAIGRAFVAKVVYNYPTTRLLIESLRTMPNLRKICGFAKIQYIPSEATFLRAFAEYALHGIGDKVHEALIHEYLSDELIGHISLDSTAIEGNEKPKKKEKKVIEVEEPKKLGRPKNGEERGKKVEEKRIDRQVNESYEVSLKELPCVCDVGCKTDSQGYKMTWIGFKLHIGTTDCGLPVAVALTSASLHDSQAAIPMMKMATDRVTYCYDLMDSAYDAKTIYDTSKNLGHVPIIDKKSSPWQRFTNATCRGYKI
ncbi:IS4 family transposase [Candidatus Magnetobacterium bavaricum]|uniref:IS4 family transposase n=1 Tax=Candidatus Magnetobacterium bavaricum TaxID=29290 RepID=A0A0F3GZC9_9BACT|nr:IS4 family transposase [Candidatus Magnetobacterium bavaricum]